MSFKLAKAHAGHVPPVRELPVASGSSFELGALLLMNGSGEWAECGADPAAIAAVSESAFGTDSLGYGGHGKKEFPPGYMQATLVKDETVFRAEYTGTLPAVDGGSYGVVRGGDGKWRVDFSDTTATRVKLVGRLTGAGTNTAEVLVTFLTANIQVLA